MRGKLCTYNMEIKYYIKKNVVDREKRLNRLFTPLP